MNVEPNPRAATEGRKLTEYELKQLMIYGACHVCGGPRTARTSVVADKQPPTELKDINVIIDMVCLWCGVAPG